MAMEIKELDVNSPGMADFYGLTGAVYAGDPFYTVPFRDAVKKSVERACFQDRQQIFLAYRDGVPSARLIARISPELKDVDGKPVGMIGFFESLENAEAVKLILQQAVAWLKEKGAGEIIGPIDGDTWHRYRFNDGPFDQAPFMMEPYNPPYYCRLWEQSGFAPLPSYFSKYVPDAAKVAEKTEKFCKRVEKGGFSFRNFRLEKFADEIRILYALSCEIFSDNYLYTEISEQDFADMYSGVKGILNPELIWFALDSNGKYSGFVFSFPNYSRALAAMKGKTGLVAKLKFFFRKKQADTLNIKTLGVIPEYRGKGLGMALMHKAYASGLAAGFKKANICLFREDNSSAKVDMDLGNVSRKYVLYRFNDVVSP